MNISAEFSLIDLQTAAYLGKSMALQDEDALLFLGYLASSFRQGYLFVTCSEKGLLPLFEDSAFHEALLRGYNTVCKVRSPYILQKDDKLFLEQAFIYTFEIDRLVKVLSASKPHVVIDELSLKNSLQNLLAANIILPEQAEAIQEACKNSLSCIWGGPGTGKTYTAGWLVKLFLEQHPKARIVLSAPTGKAAANLLESIQRVLPQAALQAKTLHSLLGIKRAGNSVKKEQLSYDLIIVDESSMIDAHLFVKLLYVAPATSRIIFLGDPFQLPPIEPGEPFVALVEQKTASNHSGKLSTTKRQENRLIIDLAEYVKDGNIDKAFSLLQTDHTSVINLLPLEERTFSLDAFVKPFYTSQTIDSFFAALLQTRLLCPQRIGPFGTLAINDSMLDLMGSQTFQPIIITKNDYELGLTNGQVGIISGDTAFFETAEVNTFRKIPQVLLSSYETAFCLSVHKSQGSEFGEVVLLLPEGSERFGRKMLYTAITRAKKKLTIYAKPETLASCILNESRACTTLLGLS